MDWGKKSKLKDQMGVPTENDASNIDPNDPSIERYSPGNALHNPFIPEGQRSDQETPENIEQLALRQTALNRLKGIGSPGINPGIDDVSPEGYHQALQQFNSMSPDQKEEFKKRFASKMQR